METPATPSHPREARTLLRVHRARPKSSQQLARLLLSRRRPRAVRRTERKITPHVRDDVGPATWQRDGHRAASRVMHAGGAGPPIDDGGTGGGRRPNPNPKNPPLAPTPAPGLRKTRP